MAKPRGMWAIRALLLALCVVFCRGDPTPTLRRWKEVQYGQLQQDGVEYFDFQVTGNVFQVFVDFDLYSLSNMGPPTMLIKYGAFPTREDYDQKRILNSSVADFNTKIDNLRTGQYFVALVGSELFDSLTAFVGRYESLPFYMNIWYSGCSDPSRVGTQCSQTLTPLKQIESPSAIASSITATDESVYSGCIDSISPEVYYSLDIPAAVWGFTITLSTSTEFELTVSAGAHLRDPADVRAGNLSYSATIDTGAGTRSVDLRIPMPRTGPWMVMVAVKLAQALSCAEATGAVFQFVPTYNRNCSSIDGGTISSPSQPVPAVDLCSVVFAPISEGRFHATKGNLLVDADFDAAQPVAGYTAWPVAGYIAQFPKRYTGTPVTIEAVVTPNVGSFQIYARVNGYPTATQFDYQLNSSEALSAFQITSGGFLGNTYEAKTQFTWSPIALPRVGTWYLLLVADGITSGTTNRTKDTSWAVDVALHTRACPEQTPCSGHGTCALRQTYQGLSYGLCDCNYGFGGRQCQTRTLAPAVRTNQIFLLVCSNLAIMPVVVVCARRRLYLESVLFFGAGLVSGVYHACDVELYCVFSFRILQQLDFALAFNMVLLLSVHFSGVRKQVKAGIQVVFLLSTIVLAINDTTSTTNWVVIGAVCVLQISVTFAYHFAIGAHRLRLGKWEAFKTFLFYSDNFHLPLGLLGLTLWGIALTCWMASSFSNYWLLHSLWHTCAMLAAACFIEFRRNDRYQMLTPFTAIDVLSPNYNLSPVPLGIKSTVERDTETVHV